MTGQFDERIMDKLDEWDKALVRDRLKAAYNEGCCDQLELLQVAKNLRTALKSWVDDCGGCDHSVGICSCADVSVLDRADEVIAKIEGK